MSVLFSVAFSTYSDTVWIQRDPDSFDGFQSRAFQLRRKKNRLLRQLTTKVNEFCSLFRGLLRKKKHNRMNSELLKNQVPVECYTRIIKSDQFDGSKIVILGSKNVRCCSSISSHRKFNKHGCLKFCQNDRGKKRIY